MTIVAQSPYWCRFADSSRLVSAWLSGGELGGLLPVCCPGRDSPIGKRADADAVGLENNDAALSEVLFTTDQANAA